MFQDVPRRGFPKTANKNYKMPVSNELFLELLYQHNSPSLFTWSRRYGIETLRKGVLDVAGGRGELAFELSVKRQIPCTVLDPRCPGGISPAPWTTWHVSRQQRLWFKTCLGIRSYVECQEYVAKCPLKQCQVGVEEAIEIAAARNQRNTCNTVNTVIREDWEDVLNCKVVVGLHPDQATGGILDLAKVLSCPFAVVPCCTFADDFPERRLGDRPVRTYDDLVEWLLATESAEKGFLMFFGKNLVVFTKSPSTWTKPKATPLANLMATERAIRSQGWGTFADRKSEKMLGEVMIIHLDFRSNHTVSAFGRRKNQSFLLNPR